MTTTAVSLCSSNSKWHHHGRGRFYRSRPALNARLYSRLRLRLDLFHLTTTVHRKTKAALSALHFVLPNGEDQERWEDIMLVIVDHFVQFEYELRFFSTDVPTVFSPIRMPVLTVWEVLHIH